MRNVFILGADDFNLAQLKTVRGAADCAFHCLATYEEIRAGPEHPVAEVLDRSLRVLRAFPDTVDGIIGWWDFPVSTMLSILRRAVGAPGPSLESVLKCEHKYWSRLEQRRCIPGHVPHFAAVDPFARESSSTPPLPFPFWLKPVKSASSFLGFRIRDADDYVRALDRIRSAIHVLAEPFNHLLSYARLPDDVSGVDGWHCIAEQIISRGRQCTLEGYVQNGRVHVYGVVDSIRAGAHRSSFSRYQYPSFWPRRVRERVIAITQRFLEYIEFDDSPFNAEYYWDTRTDEVWLLEVNTRISKSHTPLFRMVDGAYHHQIMLDVALGRTPVFPHRAGPYRKAAKFMLRAWSDARVVGVPDAAALQAIRDRFPYSEVEILVHEGMWLSQLKRQDSYSYEMAVLFLGADDQAQLLKRYRQAVAMLGLELSTS